MSAPTPSSSGQWFPICRNSSVILYLLSILFLVFGVLYVAFPQTAVNDITQIGNALGLPAPTPAQLADSFGGWLIFTFAYMVGATASSFLAAREPENPRPYLDILVVLKVTSSGTGAVFFLTQAHYAFYLATALVDALLAVVVLVVRAHLLSDMERLKRSGNALGERKRV